MPRRIKCTTLGAFAGVMQGITLVEVLVALVIVALALGAGLNVSSALTNNVQRLENVTLAQWCAENELIEMRLSGRFPVTAVSETDCTQMHKTFRLRIELQTTPNPAFKKVNVQVMDNQQQTQFSVKTVLSAN